MPAKSSSYIVAFKSNLGVITWTAYPSKEDFEKSRPDGTSESVLEEGITDARAVALVNTTSPLAYNLHAMRQATDPVSGAVDFNTLDHELAKARFSRCPRP